jgi:urease accessory protein
MLRLTARITGAPNKSACDTLRLNYDDRKRGRLRTRSVAGREVGLFLDRGQVLTDGDLLRADTGEVFRIEAAAEAVVTAHADEPGQLARISYHLGNRHVALQIGASWVRFQPDHVLENLCRIHGLDVCLEQAPFQPEPGAYQHRHGEEREDGH